MLKVAKGLGTGIVNNFYTTLNAHKLFRKMSDSTMSFVQQFNHICKKMEWKIVMNDYDYNQEIATSCYGDMLHDTERNQKFGLALKKAIEQIHKSGRKAHVLDIGTGTGLLSMLAVKYGADTVVACEAFLPMAECAINIIQQNGMSDKIKVIKKHSTSLTVGIDGDVEQKCNILVSEVFDTELIGEGAIKTFNHAHKNLLEDNCIVIPSKGTIYAQVVESDLAADWNKLRDCDEGMSIIKIPGDINSCPGAASVHDIQLSQFKQEHFKAITEVLPAFRFDWSCANGIPTHRQLNINCRCTATGKAQVVFMWWDLQMDPEGDIILSCAPAWCHPASRGKDLTEWCPKGNPAKNIPWRDHWMQAVYFLNKEAFFSYNQPITLNCYHDEFSFWFKLDQTDFSESSDREKSSVELSRPVCSCGIHCSLSRTRIGSMNDSRRRNLYLQSFRVLVKKYSHFLVLGDMSLIGFLISRLGSVTVDILETNGQLFKAMNEIREFNSLHNVHVSADISEICERIISEDSKNLCIVSEPFFRDSLLPWDNISFWYMKNELLQILKVYKPTLELPDLTTVPRKSTLRACAVQFDDLWKIAKRLNFCEGLNMSFFDDFIEKAKLKAENYVEPQPLWEYPAIALMEPFTIFEFDFSQDVPSKITKNKGQLLFPGNCRCDGVAIWAEYVLGDNLSLSTGPVEKVMLNEYISWDMFERQGIHLFRNSRDVHAGEWLNYEVVFIPESGELHFNFDISVRS